MKKWILKMYFSFVCWIMESYTERFTASLDAVERFVWMVDQQIGFTEQVKLHLLSEHTHLKCSNKDRYRKVAEILIKIDKQVKEHEKLCIYTDVNLKRRVFSIHIRIINTLMIFDRMGIDYPAS